MTTGTLEKVAPAIFVVQAPSYPITRTEQGQKLRDWERQLGQEIGFKFSMAKPEYPNETWSADSGGWCDTRKDS
jgi:hypothetical protein